MSLAHLPSFRSALLRVQPIVSDLQVLDTQLGLLAKLHRLFTLMDAYIIHRKALDEAMRAVYFCVTNPDMFDVG